MKRLPNSYYLSLVLAPLGLVLFFSLAVVLALKLMGLTSAELSKLRPYIGVISQLLTFLAPLLFFSEGRRTVRELLIPRRLIDWSRHRYFGRNAWLALALSFLTMLGLAFLASALNVTLIKLLPESWGLSTNDSVGDGVHKLIDTLGGNYLIAFLIIGILPGITEEIFFRGYLQRVLKAWLGGDTHRAVLVSSIIFSAIHFSAVGLLYRFVMGMTLGYAREYTGRLMPGILMHIGNNTLALGLMAIAS